MYIELIRVKFNLPRLLHHSFVIRNNFVAKIVHINALIATSSPVLYKKNPQSNLSLSYWILFMSDVERLSEEFIEQVDGHKAKKSKKIRAQTQIWVFDFTMA